MRSILLVSGSVSSPQVSARPVRSPNFRAAFVAFSADITGRVDTGKARIVLKRGSAWMISAAAGSQGLVKVLQTEIRAKNAAHCSPVFGELTGLPGSFLWPVQTRRTAKV